MSFVLYLASLVSLTFAGCPKGGYITEDSDNAGVCGMKCYDSDTFVIKDDLTFAEIKDDCESVQLGAKFGTCTSKNHLIWSDSYCQCPYCKCSEASSGIPYSRQKMISKTCYNCSCSTASSTSTDLVFNCDEVLSTNDPYSWEDFSCPTDGTNFDNFALCEDGGDTYAPTDYWFSDENVTEGVLREDCDTFCYCKAGGIKECQTGFANIVNLGSEQLKGAFWDKCSYYTEACWSTPATMVASEKGTYSWSSCDSWSSCPKCPCPSGHDTVGDVFFVEHNSEYGYIAGEADAARCEHCECKEYSATETYASCDDYDSYPDSSEYDYECPPPRSISCHSQSSEDPALEAENYETTYSNDPELFCSIDLEVEDGDTDDWDWSGYGSIFCGLYGGVDECFKYSIDYEHTNCYGQSVSESSTRYEWCCSEDNCNYFAGDTKIDTATCATHSGLTALFSELYSCAMEDAQGEDCDDEDEVVSCAAIAKQYKVVAQCYCEAYTTLYDDAGESGVNAGWKPWIKTQIDMFMTNFEEWNDALGCSATFDCDLDTGVFVVRSAAVSVYKPYVVFIFGFVSLFALF